MGFKVGGDAVHGLADGDDEPAVDDKLRELRTTFIRVAAVPNKELGQMVELGDAKVCGQRRLATFLADNADTDVGGLDHRDIIATIANAGNSPTSMLTD